MQASATRPIMSLAACWAGKDPPELGKSTQKPRHPSARPATFLHLQCPPALPRLSPLIRTTPSGIATNYGNPSPALKIATPDREEFSLCKVFPQGF